MGGCRPEGCCRFAPNRKGKAAAKKSKRKLKERDVEAMAKKWAEGLQKTETDRPTRSYKTA
jgi:hypothetical protein